MEVELKVKVDTNDEGDAMLIEELIELLKQLKERNEQ